MGGLNDFLLAVVFIGLLVWAGFQTNQKLARMAYFKGHDTRAIMLIGAAVAVAFFGGIGMVYLLFNGFG